MEKVFFFSFYSSPCLAPFFLFEICISLIRTVLEKGFAFRQFHRQIYLFEQFLVAFLLYLLVLFLDFTFPGECHYLTLQLPSTFNLQIMMIICDFPNMIGRIP